VLHEIIFKLFKIDDSCKSCETLRHQIDIANAERRLLLDSILSLTNPSVKEEPQVEYKPITPKHIPWAVKKEMLEEADRVKAKERRTIDELEKELKVNDNAS